MKEILDNLNFFSELTQDTLSAFHFTGVDSNLYEDIEELKRALLNITNKKIKTVVYNNKTKKYTRYFTDGTSDEVEDESHIFTEVKYKQNDILLKKLQKDPSFIMKIKMGKLKSKRNIPIKNIIEELFLKQ